MVDLKTASRTAPPNPTSPFESPRVRFARPIIDNPFTSYSSGPGEECRKPESPAPKPIRLTPLEEHGLWAAARSVMDYYVAKLELLVSKQAGIPASERAATVKRILESERVWPTDRPSEELVALAASRFRPSPARDTAEASKHVGSREAAVLHEDICQQEPAQGGGSPSPGEDGPDRSAHASAMLAMAIAGIYKNGLSTSAGYKITKGKSP